MTAGCSICENPMARFDLAERTTWCVSCQDRVAAHIRDRQPRVWRRNMPRCPICHHHPRLLDRRPDADLFVCRWGHDVLGRDVAVRR